MSENSARPEPPQLTTDDLVDQGLVELNRRADGIYLTLTDKGRRYGLRLETGDTGAGPGLIVRVTGDASAAEGFDEHQTALYLREIVAQGNLANMALSRLKAARREVFADFAREAPHSFGQDVQDHVLAVWKTRPGIWRVERSDELFMYAETVLAHAATVSHILVPGRTMGDKGKQRWAKDRGRLLRGVLGLPPALLRKRTVRDAVVHIDERLDDQAMRPPEVGLADRRVVLESHAWSLEKFGWRRVLVLDTLTYVFDSDRLDLQEVGDALADLADCAHWWLEDYQGTPLEGLVSVRGKPVWFGSQSAENTAP
jgi:hypothetical protein